MQSAAEVSRQPSTIANVALTFDLVFLAVDLDLRKAME